MNELELMPSRRVITPILSTWRFCFLGHQGDSNSCSFARSPYPGRRRAFLFHQDTRAARTCDFLLGTHTQIVDGDFCLSWALGEPNSEHLARSSHPRRRQGVLFFLGTTRTRTKDISLGHHTRVVDGVFSWALHGLEPKDFSPGHQGCQTY